MERERIVDAKKVQKVSNVAAGNGLFEIFLDVKMWCEYFSSYMENEEGVEVVDVAEKNVQLLTILIETVSIFSSVSCG